MNPLRGLRLSGLLLICLCVVTLGCTQSHEVAEGLKAPSLNVHDAAKGEDLKTESLKGKVLFVNFWATWCAPCREEVPSIDSLFSELKDDSRFAMVTILYRDTSGAATDYLGANGFSFPVYTDSDGSTATRFKVTGVPETFLIDKKGVLRKRIIGALSWDSPEAKTYIQELLNE